MAAPADYLDAVDLKNATAGGLVREDVLQKIFDCSEIPTPFLDMVGEGSFTNSYSEWTQDALGSVDTTNAVVSGSDVSTYNSAVGTRVGNHAQISRKVVAVTTRGEQMDSIGGVGGMGYQTARRLQELRRDVEAIALSKQASVADDNNTTAGKTAGVSAWIITNDSSGSGGSATGFNTSTKVVATPTVGTARGLTFALIRTQLENVYTQGGNTTVLMSVPAVTKSLSSYLFTTPYAAIPTANVSGTSPVNQVSNGYIDVFRSDFGFTVKIVPNRLQQKYDSADSSSDLDAADVFLFDPQYLQVAYLYGYKVEPIAKLGLSERKQISVDWMTKVLLEKAQAVIRDVAVATAVAAS